MTCAIYVLLLLVVVVTEITLVTSKSCDILENLSCECHSSSNGENQQLLCNDFKNSIEGAIELANSTGNEMRSFDTFHLTFYDKEMNISSMFINALAALFPRSPTIAAKKKPLIKITLSFHNFQQLYVEDYAFHQLFDGRSYFTTMLALEFTSNGQITFSSMAFSQLTVDRMYLHSSSLEPYSFEEIFNNTNIGDLTLEGCTPSTNETLRTNFKGRIQSAKFAKMVELVSSEEFPNYPVRSMIIEAHEARRINASTFMNYSSLSGLHLIRAKFFFDDRSFQGLQYLTNLETIELDAETVKDHTFRPTARIGSLILGQHIRFLTDRSLDDLNALTRFDASKIALDQLYPSSRCVLARYILKQQKANPAMMILPPVAEQCDCIYDFMLSILNKKPNKNYVEQCENHQHERCQLSECDVVKNFRLPRKEKVDDEQYLPPSIIDGVVDKWGIPLYPVDERSTATHRSPVYVHRHPLPADDDNEQIKPSDKDSQASALKANEPVDPNAIPVEHYDEYMDSASTRDYAGTFSRFDDEEQQIAMKNERYKWIAVSLVCATVLCLLLIGTCIWFLTCNPMKRYGKAGFQPVVPPIADV